MSHKQKRTDYIKLLEMYIMLYEMILLFYYEDRRSARRCVNHEKKKK